MSYDKMNDFIETVYHVFNTINNKADANRDKRQKFIAFLILGYVSNLAKLHNID